VEIAPPPGIPTLVTSNLLISLATKFCDQPIPAGKYVAAITESKLKPKKVGTS
jgi:hypothetical protein